jgi:predicted Zn-dependent protease
MLQPIEADSLPALGVALLKAEQGDTAAAIAGLERVAAGLPPEKGAAELRLHAGALARAAGRTAEAERLFRAAIVPEAKATAPAAELALGQLLIDLNRGAEAVKVLEQMILSHPESALVPQARRALDVARGAVPPT